MQSEFFERVGMIAAGVALAACLVGGGLWWGYQDLKNVQFMAATIKTGNDNLIDGMLQVLKLAQASSNDSNGDERLANIIRNEITKDKAQVRGIKYSDFPPDFGESISQELSDWSDVATVLDTRPHTDLGLVPLRYLISVGLKKRLPEPPEMAKENSFFSVLGGKISSAFDEHKKLASIESARAEIYKNLPGLTDLDCGDSNNCVSFDSMQRMKEARIDRLQENHGLF